MIAGIGLDLVELARIARLWNKYGQTFARKILHSDELATLPANPVNYLAGRFAAKEAAVKALGTGFSEGIWFQDFNIFKDVNGSPCLKLYGKAAQIAEKKEILHTYVSISHEQNTAAAVVIFEKL